MFSLVARSEKIQLTTKFTKDAKNEVEGQDSPQRTKTSHDFEYSLKNALSAP